MSRRRTLLLISVAAAACLSAAATVPEQAVKLRNLGIAELENEQPSKAQEAFAELARLVPGDPLPHANLAIALLRQQQFEPALEAIARAHELAPGRADLIAVEAEIRQWAGQPDRSLELLREAAALAPDDPLIQYAYLRQAGTLASDDDVGRALERLARLRPENLLVMLQLGQRAIRDGDRAGATAAFLRLRELVWQAPEAAQGLLEEILTGLEAGDTAAVRVPALRLENVLKITAMYRGSQRELDVGIQGDPLLRLAGEPRPAAFGEPVTVSFEAERLAAEPATGGVAAGDFNADGSADLAWLSAGESPRLEVRLAGGEPARLPAAGVQHLTAADLDNDGHLDLLGWGADKLLVWRGSETGGFSEATAAFGLERAGATAVAVLDFDIEGDLDLALAGGRAGSGQLYRNALDGPLSEVGAKALPGGAWREVRDLVASDLDRDGDVDLVVAHGGGTVWLDNLRQGRFAPRTGGFEAARALALAAADLDNDGLPELIVAGDGVAVWHNQGGRFAPWKPAGDLRSSARFTAVTAFDADNDGRLDLALAGPRALAVLRQKPAGGFELVGLTGAPPGGLGLTARDLDGDGDLDLALAAAGGLYRLDNRGGNRNHWLAVQLRGLDKGNSKNNVFGLGSWVEVKAGTAYQFREAASDVVHFGLGRLPAADLLRVVWTNGVPQNRLAPRGDQRIVEEQLLKGSCPFLYAWDGERFRFVTDLLWGAPAGLPVAEGVWAGADPDELVVVEGAHAVDGVYRLRVTEELWEAAFFDRVRLWVVDHPEGVEVASNLRVVPGRRMPDAVLASRDLRPLAAAVDAAGRDVTARVAARDEIYADGWRPSRYQGVAAEPWSFVFDLGEAPAAPVRLHLDGWIFPADASLNLAVAQRRDLPPVPTVLEVETADGWQPLVPDMGFPAGKTKTMVVDTPPLPADAHRLRIVSNQWLHWDRIAWTVRPADDEPRVTARLLPSSAELRYRGFSAPVREAPNAPHRFDYHRVRSESPWLPFAGRYTRFGEVGELLAELDDRLVILGPGDEMALDFDTSRLPPPPDGWRRTVLLESFGWDKDADRNTWQAEQVEPLPFGAMTGYPYGPGESYPDSPELARYRERWLTRQVGGDR